MCVYVCVYVRERERERERERGCVRLLIYECYVRLSLASVIM